MYLHESILDFKRLMGKHTGGHMARELFRTLEEFDITEKLFCITSDAASNNTKMAATLEVILRDEKQMKWSAEEMHINCLNHIINRAVQEFLTKIKVTYPDNEEQGYDEEEEDEDEGEEAEDNWGCFSAIMTKIRGVFKVRTCLYNKD
jgi:hypothetical protein